MGFATLNLLLDAGQADHRRQGALECVYAFELTADVRRSPAHSGAQRNGATIGVPNDAAGWLGSEHADPVRAQQPTGLKIARSAWTGGLFVGYEDDPDTPLTEQSFIAHRRRRVNHRRQPALHVRRAATEKICAFDTWLKLIPPLRRHNIVVATEVKRSRTGSSRRENARAFPPHVIEAEPVQFADENERAFVVLIPGWILRWDCDQSLRKLQHRRRGKPLA